MSLPLIITAFSSAVWRRIPVTVAASATETIDVRAFSTFKATKYIISACNDANTVYRTFEILATKSGTDVKNNKSGSSGDALDLDTSVLKSGSDVLLSLTNNESFAVTVTVYKLDIR